ncbi:MAG: porin [Phycisphaerales bacterium]|nr:porin [Phycisphaerales bacterium]
MSLTNRFGLVAGTTALAIAGSAFGGAESNNDALSQIAELKQELAQLKQENSQDWLTEQRSAEIRGIVQDVLADADTRTSLQSSGAMAGYNNGFFLASPDGNFSLKIGGQVQIRWTLNHAKAGYSAGGGAPVGSPNDMNLNTQWGFENRRTKLNFEGNVFSKDWTYRVRAAFNQGTTMPGNAADGAAAIDFAYIEKSMDNGMSIRVGQFHAPWMREVLVDSAYQLAAERSVLAGLFGQGYSQGIQVGYQTEGMRFTGGAFDGIGGQNSTFTSGGNYNSQNTNWDNTRTNYSFAGRAEFKISGDWSQFNDFSSAKGSEAGMMAGVAAVYQRANWNSTVSSSKMFGVTGDFTWDFGGASLFASGVWVNNEDPTGNKNNPWGVSVQGGYFVTEEAELFARYEFINYDTPDTGVGSNKYNGMTVGANYFFNANVKLTCDFTYNLKSLSGDNANGALNGAGLRQDSFENGAGFGPANGGNDGQYVVRAQLQLLF